MEYLGRDSTFKKTNNISIFDYYLIIKLSFKKFGRILKQNILSFILSIVCTVDIPLNYDAFVLCCHKSVFATFSMTDQNIFHLSLSH